MRTNFLHGVAVAFGLCTIGTSQAQYQNYPLQPLPTPLSDADTPFTHVGTNEIATTSGLRRLPSVDTPGTSQPLPSPSYPNAYQGTPYEVPPSFRGSFQPVANQHNYLPTAIGSGALQAPSVESIAAGLPEPQPIYGPYSGTTHDDLGVAGNESVDQNCEPCMTGQVYHDAASAPWVGSAPHGVCAPESCEMMPIRSWFGGGNLLFLDYESNFNRRILYNQTAIETTTLKTSDVDPDAHVGFETFFGRYFGCGRYAFMANYFFFNPGSEEYIRTPMVAGGDGTLFRSWDRIDFDLNGDGNPDDVGAVGAGDDSLFGIFDAATSYRIRRDVDFQGLEFNFVSFAIGGARRAGTGLGCADACSTCGGLGGPMIPAYNDRVQIGFSHGLRWFQFKDALEIGASVTDTMHDGGTDDYYYNVDVENNLFGYQFGSTASYLLTCRISAYAGAKFGIYANDADYRARIGTRDVVGQGNGFYPTYDNQEMSISRDETVLSTLGELDLGIGFRLARCWSLTSGYRLIGATGVATSVGNIADDPAHTLEGHFNDINESLILHGGYVGLLYNW